MPAKSGEICPECKEGKLLVNSTRVDHRLNMRFRYLRCNACGHKPANKIAVPLEFAPPRISHGKAQSKMVPLSLAPNATIAEAASPIS